MSLKNFAKVSGDLYRGAQPDREGFKELKDMGIKTIINLRSFHFDRHFTIDLNFIHYQIPCKAWHPEEEDVKRFLEIVNEQGNSPSFVHCQHGADRTGTMVAIYRIVIQGWSYEDAIAELPKFGMHKIWIGIKPFIKKYQTAKSGERRA